MSQVYHLNKKQTSRAFKVLNAQEVYLTCIKSYVEKASIKNHTDTIPAFIYVREDTRSTPNNLLRWKAGVLTPPGGFVYGSIIFAYGDKTYANLPAHLKLTDEQVENLML